MQQQTDTVYLNFYSPISQTTVQTLMAACTDAMRQFNPRTLYLSISSSGGEVAAGITLYNFLRGLPVRVVTHNIGAIDSIAVVIFLAGQDRYAVPTATFLFHGVQLGISQPTNLTIYQLRELVSGLDEDHNRIVHVITGRTKLSEDEVRELFAQGESKNPTFAVEREIIAAIQDFAVPQGAPFFSLNT
ncbi:MAG: Clp protease [Acidobacteria bacterium]|nr:MAG: Clp protease [Acidobacteriota bacterium]